MQNLPGVHNRNTQAYDALADAAASTGHSSSYGRDSLDFGRLIQEASANVPAEVTPELDAVPDETATQSRKDEDSSLSSTDTPYASTTEPIAPSTLDTSTAIPAADIRLTDAEVYKVAEALRKEGVDEKTIHKVTALAGHPGGVAVRDVVKAVAQDSAAKLTEGDLVRIRSLADTLDPTGGLGDVMLNALRSGDTMLAWGNLTQFVNSLSPDATMNIDRDAVVSLGKAMRLDENTLKGLKKAFGENESATLSPEGFKALMNPAQKSLEENFAAQQKLADKLEKAMSPVISDARARLESEALTASKESRRIQQSRILIQDTVTQNSFAREDGATVAAVEKEKQKTMRQPAQSETDTRVGHSDTARSSEQAEQAKENPTAASIVKTAEAQSSRSIDAQSAKNAESQSVKKTESTTTQVATNTHAVNAARQSSDSEFDGQGRQDGNTFANSSKTAAMETTQSKTSDSSPWEGMLQRLNGIQGPGTVQPQIQTANVMRTGQQAFSRSVLSQVESGVMTAMQDGVNRLELQLNPLDLGVVNVVLTSRNGEISALLRPERPETASMLVQQMDQLRLNLEEQGLKVSKVDVQTQTGNEQGMSWQGTSQHNSAQEQQSRAMDMDRMRRMARTRQQDNSIPLNGTPPSLLSRTLSMGSSLNIVA